MHSIARRQSSVMFRVFDSPFVGFESMYFGAGFFCTLNGSTAGEGETSTSRRSVPSDRKIFPADEPEAFLGGRKWHQRRAAQAFSIPREDKTRTESWHERMTLKSLETVSDLSESWEAWFCDSVCCPFPGAESKRSFKHSITTSSSDHEPRNHTLSTVVAKSVRYFAGRYVLSDEKFFSRFFGSF